jgi:serine/threonine protein kinase
MNTKLDDAKDLIKHLLHVNPDDRFTPAEVLNHTWITTVGPRTSGKLLFRHELDCSD